MTFDEWINNPAGKSAVMTNRQMYRDLYTSKFNKIMLREGNQFVYKCYKNKDSTQYVIHIKVPSEVIAKFYYDVVISFTGKGSIISNNSIKSYNVQFYSNSPDFVYTHCYAYNKANLFISELSKRMNKESLTEKAKIRNPYNMISYVKSIYFAYLIMKYKGLFSKDAYKEDLNLKKLLSEIRNADEVVAARQQAQSQLNINKKKEEIKKAQEVSDNHREKIFNKSSGNVTKTHSIGNISMVKSTKKTKRSKRI